MTRKDDYSDSYYKIIDKVNERHMEVERKKFEKTINNRSTNLILLILAILAVVAIIVIFVIIGFQPQQESVFLQQADNWLSFHSSFKIPISNVMII